MHRIDTLRAHSMNQAAVSDAIAEYATTVDALLGFFFDCRMGFLANVRDGRSKDALAKERYGIAPDDSHAYIVGTDPRIPGARAFHRTTQGDHRKRNDFEGSNHRLAGQLLIVALFAYWEHPRARIAEAVGCVTNEVEIDSLGDLRYLRHAIVHRQARLSSGDRAKLKAIQMPEGLIAPDHDACVAIVHEIYRGLGEFAAIRGVEVPTLVLG